MHIIQEILDEIGQNIENTKAGGTVSDHICDRAKREIIIFNFSQNIIVIVASINIVN